MPAGKPDLALVLSPVEVFLEGTATDDGRAPPTAVATPGSVLSGSAFGSRSSSTAG
ncbi:MAG TPA: hypothetical protein VFS30_13750 [Dehalococcoidia bacterium]|nr:hypothetical protein [Dehalococcoidia bacterium]